MPHVSGQCHPQKLYTKYTIMSHFIYLSIDDSFEKWQQSSKKHNLEKLKYNYLIENRYTSTFLESLGLSSIPRYLIFDRKGNLVHQNAPGSDSDEIRDLFDKYLNDWDVK